MLVLPSGGIIGLESHVTDNFPPIKLTCFSQRAWLCASVDNKVVRVERDNEIFIVAADHYFSPRSLKTIGNFSYY
jgi:hypothetical protein